MKRILLLLFIVSPAFTIFSYAQDLTGIWRGYFIDAGMRQYRYEVQLEQTKKNNFSGVTYSYLGKSFYGKTSMVGSFNISSSEALIQEVKTIELKLDPGSVACIQKCLLTYVKSGPEEFLEGTFTSIYEKTDSISGNRKGDDCGGGKMYLRKVKTSDFYIEPFLRNKSLPKLNTPPPVVNNLPAVKPPVSKPVPGKPIVNKPPVNTQKNNSNTKPVNSNLIAKPKNDSIKKADVAVINSAPPQKITLKPSINIPPVLQERENNLLQTIIINSENVTVKLYDNGEIDDDTISVYLDNQLVLSKKRLTTAALTINLKMNESDPDHELVMVADNLGRIPPNTSLMIVTAGDKRYEVRITSTEQKNALVRFKYVKPGVH